jgi:2-polyprenyl-3-methyl-5-hydroxy-6-metoxy-1,4-benzoquinol methylase
MLPSSGVALDVACGRGRHALWLAAQGLTTYAIDRDEAAISALREGAGCQGLPLIAKVCDLEIGEPDLGCKRYDVIVVVHYLYRPLLPMLVKALAPDGVLVYETFTSAQAMRGHPTNSDFLLESGELLNLVQPLKILKAREGEVDGLMLASVIATRVSR